MRINIKEIATIIGPAKAPPPATEVRQPALPRITLHDSAQSVVTQQKDWLRAQPIEHFVGIHLDRSGRVVGISEFAGDATRCQVSVPLLLAESTAFGGSAVLGLHNHPGGMEGMSPEDERTTALLQQQLEREGKVLYSHEVVSGQPAPLREAAPLLTDWHARVAEQQRLWGCYGGKPPW